MSEKTFIHILDSSLRDGSHALSHQYTAAQVSSVARGLDDAGVEMIEVSHGDGLGGSTVTYGFSKQSEMELIQAAAEVIKNGKLAVLLLPGIGTKDDLKMAADYGAKVAQIATHVTEADIAEQHIGVAKKMGMEVIGMLMLSHMASPEKIAEQGKAHGKLRRGRGLGYRLRRRALARYGQAAGCGIARSAQDWRRLSRSQQSLSCGCQQHCGD